MLTDLQERELRTTVSILQNKISLLEETIVQLKTEKFKSVWHPPLSLGLTSKESKILSYIYSHENFASKEELYDHLYSFNLDCDFPEENIITVYVCKIRRKMKPFGIDLNLKRVIGYYLTQENKNKLDTLKLEDGL